MQCEEHTDLEPPAWVQTQSLARAPQPGCSWAVLELVEMRPTLRGVVWVARAPGSLGRVFVGVGGFRREIYFRFGADGPFPAQVDFSIRLRWKPVAKLDPSVRVPQNAECRGRLLSPYPPPAAAEGPNPR